MGTLDLQISKFVNKHNVLAEHTAMAKAADLFKDYSLVPTTLFEIELGPNGPINKNRIRLSDDNEFIAINIGAERIDIIFDYRKGKQMSLSHAAIAAVKYLEILERIDESINWDGKRLAYNIREQIEYSSGKSTTMYSAMVIPIDYYVPLETVEWGTVQNRRIKWINRDIQEDVNVFLRVDGIFNISKITPPKEAIIHIDINTAQDNMSSRFLSDDIKEFTTYAQDISLKVAGQVKSKLGI